MLLEFFGKVVVDLNPHGYSSRLMSGALASRWVERTDVHISSGGGLGHRIVDLKDQSLGPELAVVALVILRTTVNESITCSTSSRLQAIKVEHRSIELRAQELAPLGDPPEGRAWDRHPG